MARVEAGLGRHEFGGDWTEQKLKCLEDYLHAYMKIMKSRGFRLLYVDAFAGTGSRYCEEQKPETTDAGLPGILQVKKEQARFFEGSALKALQFDPPFDHLVFIERDADKAAHLHALANDHPKRVSIKNEDANAALQWVCEVGDWRGTRTGRTTRAVVFLDPYGMQVDWQTIEAIARTGGIDMWYLFPSGLGVNRMIAKRRESLTPGWEMRLDRCLGETGWRDVFYKQTVTPGLFGDIEREEKIATIDEIEAYFLGRLRTVFPYVAPNALAIRNSKGYKMFSLCFAASAEKGGGTAVKIANHLLRGGRKKA